MTNTNKYQDYDIITIIIVLVSCIITTLIHELKCLISQNSESFIPTPGKHVGPSRTTTSTSTSSTKNQRRSRSTKPSSDTVDHMRAAGTGQKDTQRQPTAFSPKSKRSKPSSNSQKNTKSQTNQTSDCQLHTPAGKLVSVTLQQNIIPQNDRSTADE